MADLYQTIATEIPAATPSVALRTWAHSTPIALIGQVRFFGYQTIMIEIPAARRSIVLRTWAHSTPILLIGQDRFFGDPGQAPANLDWPVPKGKQYPASLRSMTHSQFIWWLYDTSATSTNKSELRARSTTNHLSARSRTNHLRVRDE